MNERFPIKLDDVASTDNERKMLLTMHRARYFREVNAGELPPVDPVPLDEPECEYCGEKWTNGIGCPTVRAVVRLGVLEREFHSQSIELKAAEEYCAEVGMRGQWWKDPSTHTLKINATFDVAAYTFGGENALVAFGTKLFNDVRGEFRRHRGAK